MIKTIIFEIIKYTDNNKIAQVFNDYFFVVSKIQDALPSPALDDVLLTSKSNFFLCKFHTIW